MNRELGPGLEKPVFYWCHLTMARTLRLEYPGGVYHVTSQGNARQNLLADAAHQEERGGRWCKTTCPSPVPGDLFADIREHNT
jgi:hypothetical protein